MSLLADRFTKWSRRVADHLGLRNEELVFVLCLAGLTLAGAVVSGLRSGPSSVPVEGNESARAFAVYAGDSTATPERLDSLAGVIEGSEVVYWTTQRDSLKALLSARKSRQHVDSFFSVLGDAPVKMININEATAAELASLPGIGPKIAERIIQYRSEHGKFKNIEELRSVKGIGKKLFAKIQPFIDIH